MAKLNFLFLIFCCIHSNAQNIIEGSIVNKNTGKPVPYVNIFLKKKSSLGTISNAEGKFRLRSNDNDSVVFSHVSFKRKAIGTQQTANLKRVELEESEKMLSEVVIMSDSTLLGILRQAFSKIETNYPSGGTLFEGFFRETNKVVEDNKFIYFGESTIQFYKPGYSNRSFGRVKLVNGAKSEIANRLKYSNIYYYSGVYTPQKFDIVKQRADFINPSHFKRYNYSVVRISKEGDHEIMEIEFKPNPGACCTGRFQLDRKSLAYTGAQYELTQAGLREDRLVDLTPRDYTEVKRDVRYREIDGRWNLNVVIIESTLYNPGYKNHLHTTREFVATSITQIDHDPIKESEAITYTDIYSQQDSKFNDDYWKENSTIARDSALQKEVNLLFSSKDLVIDKEQSPTMIADKKKSQQSGIKILSRINSQFGLAISPINVQPGLWTIAYGGETYSKNVSQASYVWTLDEEFGIKLNRSFAAFIGITTGLSKEKNAGAVRFGVNYRKRLAGWKHPLWLYAGAGIGKISLQQSITNNMTIYKSLSTVTPSLQLNYKFAANCGLIAGVTVASILKSKEKLSVLKKKNIFNARYKRTDLTDPSVDFRIDGIQQSESGLDFTKNPTFIRVGLYLGFN